MSKFLIMNARPLMFWFAISVAAFSFFGLKGIGTAAVLYIILQIILL